eukprot:jgi/Bigna1/90768/estExt_fgenesh1_pg.C_790006
MSSSSGNARVGSKSKAIGPYVLGRPLGFGTTSRVHLAVHSVTKSAAAVKIIRKKPCLDLRKLQREISILRLLNHRYITRLYDVFESKNHIYMVMELVDGGELFDHIIQQKRLRRYDALRVFRQVAEATAYFHDHGIVHRDIKPENILVHSTGDIKIADFGFAIARKDGCLKTSCGSPHYACPEVCSSSLYDGTKADSWSLGVLLFVLITGDFPFNDQNYGALFHRIQTGKYMIPSYVDQDIAELITRLLAVDPDARLSVKEILQHSCMKPFDSSSQVDGRGDSKRSLIHTFSNSIGKEVVCWLLLNGVPTYLPTYSSDRQKKRGRKGSDDSCPASPVPLPGEEGQNNRGCSDMMIDDEDGGRCNGSSSAAAAIDNDDIAPITDTVDPKAVQELVYLGWGENLKEVEAALLGKNPKVSKTIRTAYRTLVAKFSADAIAAAATANSKLTPHETTSKPPKCSSKKAPPPVQRGGVNHQQQNNTSSSKQPTSKRGWGDGNSSKRTWGDNGGKNNGACKGGASNRRRRGVGTGADDVLSPSMRPKIKMGTNDNGMSNNEGLYGGKNSSSNFRQQASSAEREIEQRVRQQRETQRRPSGGGGGVGGRRPGGGRSCHQYVSGPLSGRRVLSEPVGVSDPSSILRRGGGGGRGSSSPKNVMQHMVKPKHAPIVEISAGDSSSAGHGEAGCSVQ